MSGDEKEVTRLIEAAGEDERCSSRNNKTVAVVAMSPSPENGIETNGVKSEELNGRENGHVEEEQTHSGEVHVNGINKNDSGDPASSLVQAEGANRSDVTEPFSSLPAKEQNLQGEGEKVPSCQAEAIESDQSAAALIGKDATAGASSPGEAFTVVKPAEEGRSSDGERYDESNPNDAMEKKEEGEQSISSSSTGNDPVGREVEKMDRESPTGAEVLEDVNNDTEETTPPPRSDGVKVVEQGTSEEPTPTKEEGTA